MTFTIVARDHSGAVGIAVASSSPSVAARCIHLRSGVGGVASQNITDPRYGPRILDALEGGSSARGALESVLADDATAPYRQVLVVDAGGDVAAHSGDHTLGRYSVVESDGLVTGGNLLSDTQIPHAMADAFKASTGDLESRLLAGLSAAEAAGGEAGDIHSCGLAVVRDAGWNVTDLRVDWDETDPIGRLAFLLELWLPQRDDYVTRGRSPNTSPAYGVPGDE